LSEPPAAQDEPAQEDRAGWLSRAVGAALLGWAALVAAVYYLQFKPVVVKIIRLIGGGR